MDTHDRDRNVSNLARFAPLGIAAALLAPLMAGCGGSGGSDSCAAGSGNGMLMINISGHDPGAVTVEGMSGVVTTSSTVSVPAGPHMVTAARVTTANAGITSDAYEGTIDKPMPCVKAGAIAVVNVTYALIPTSGVLWLGVSNAPEGATMLGYLPASVAATGTVLADAVTNTGGSDGFTFDKAGNMWVLGGTTADPPLARYPASMFASDAFDKVPDIMIDSPSFGSAIPGPKVVAFDPQGDLWVSVVASDKVIKFRASQIAASGAPTAMVERTGLTSPQGLAFDSTGNLWVAAHDDNTVVRIDAGAHQTTSGAGGDLAITAQFTDSVGTSTLRFPIGLAFDAAGNLWVNYFDGHLAKIPVADQSGTGSKMITPPVVINTDVLTLPVGIAFDQDGGLWVAGTVNSFARFDATQLAASGAPTPSRIITSSDVGSAAWFAMYPAPASLPLYHKVP
jgi:sugar lactone lactonase YvrE